MRKHFTHNHHPFDADRGRSHEQGRGFGHEAAQDAVSYTHLTLPTN